jgi:hypothetical protein
LATHHVLLGRTGVRLHLDYYLVFCSFKSPCFVCIFLIIIVVCSSSSFLRLILKNGGMYVCGSGFEIKNDSSKCKMILSTINPGSGGA